MSQDPLKKIKTIAYCRVMGPIGKNPTLDQFVLMAKSYLSIQNRVLMKDPIWDTYTQEELLIEYFSSVYFKDEEERSKFEMQLEGLTKASEYDSFLEFANKAIEENQKELEKRDEELPDNVSFNPDTLGD